MSARLELVQFQTSDKLLLPGLLYEPARKTNRVLISLHGNGSSSAFYNVTDNNLIADTVNRRDVAFFPFNNRGAHYIKKLHKDTTDGDDSIVMGMAYELIKECIYDIDAAIKHLKSRGYNQFYLLGFSTGANKICVYNYYKPQNSVDKYILASGGDDTGLYYQWMGAKKFNLALQKTKQKIKQSKGRDLVPKYLTDSIFSYQSLYDILNPDGDYNIFPFNESMNNLKLSKKPLFRHYKSIKKPTLVVYGKNDEYCYGDVPRCVDILKQHTGHPDKFTFKIIKDADHGFHGKEKQLAKMIADWL